MASSWYFSDEEPELRTRTRFAGAPSVVGPTAWSVVLFIRAVDGLSR